MKIFVDENIPLITVKELRSKRFDVYVLKDLMLLIFVAPRKRG